MNLSSDIKENQQKLAEVQKLMGLAAERLREFGLDSTSERADRSSSMIDLSQDSCCDFEQADDCKKVGELSDQIKKERAQLKDMRDSETSLKKQVLAYQHKLEEAKSEFEAVKSLAQI